MKQSVMSLFSFLLVFAANAQTEKGGHVIRGGYGISYNYILSSQKTNTSPSNTLFGGNGHSLRIGIEWDPWGGKGKAATQADKLSPRLGLAFDLGFQFGKTSTKDLEAFAKTLTTPVSYKIIQSSTNWKQAVVMAGPMLRLGKRNTGLPPLEIAATAGAAFRLAPRRIEIIRVDGAVPGAKVFDQTENNTAFAWQAIVSVPVVRLGKRSNGIVWLEAGYRFNGGTAGVTYKVGKRYRML